MVYTGYNYAPGLAFLNEGVDTFVKGMKERSETQALLAAFDASGNQAAQQQLPGLGQGMQGQPRPSAQGMPGLGQGSVPRGSLGVDVAENEADVQRLEKQMSSYAPMASREQQYGLPSGFLGRTAQIESGGNPNAQNPNSSAGGAFQFIDSTAKQYGLTNKFDPNASADAAARLAFDNKRTLMAALGREPTAGELYLAHQQGGGGASKLLANPNARAVDIVGADAVRLNGGTADMTAGQFASRWVGKFGSGQGSPQPVQMAGAPSQQRDDPATLRKDAEFYRTSSPEASRQFLARAEAAERGQPVQMAQNGVTQSDMPAANAEETQGFAVPGEPSRPQASPQGQPGGNSAMIRTLLASPGTRQIGQQLWAQSMGKADFGFQVVGDQLYRTNQRTGQIEPVGISKPVQPVSVKEGEKWIDPRTGAVVYDGGPAKQATPANVQEYKFAQERGFTGSYLDFQRELAGQKNQKQSISEQNKERETEANRLGYTGENRDFYIANGKLPGANEKMTGDQANAGLYADRMRAADKILTDPQFIAAGMSRTQKALGANGQVGSLANSDEYKRFDQAKLDFITAKLRRESGAAISPTEFEKDDKAFFPQPSDPPALIQQKAEARARVIDGISRAGGPSYAKANPAGTKQNDGEPSRATPAAPKAGDVQEGHRYKGGDPSQPSSWVKVN